MSFDVDQFIEKFSGLTESYWFYDNTVELRYDVKGHKYLLSSSDGLLEQDGVTTVCHIIDKSEVLIPWGCKMMQQKILALTPFIDGTVILSREAFEKIIADSKNAHKEKLEDAGEVGHIAHSWIENYIKSVLAKDMVLTEQLLLSLPADERASNSCMAALAWMVAHNVRWLSTERKVYSLKYGYAGTMDGLALVDSCSDPNCCPKHFKDRLTVVDWKTSNYLYPEFRMQTAAYLKAYVEEMHENVTDRWVLRLDKENADFDPWHLDENTTEDDFQAFVSALELKRNLQVIIDDIQKVKSVRREKFKAEKEAAKEAAKEAELQAKFKAKQEKQAAKAEALRHRCANSGKYKGKRYPRCNGGLPCEFCLNLYEQVQAGKLPPKPDPAKEAIKLLIELVEIPGELDNTVGLC